MSRIALFTTLVIALALVVVQGCSSVQTPFNREQANRLDTDEAKLTRSVSTSIPTVGDIDPIIRFYGPMPTGVAVSHSGRIFVNYPRWGDPVEYTVAEVKDGRTVPFPDAQINNFVEGNESDHLVSAQSVVVDPQDRLWILDTATINMGPTLSGGPKLICVDLKRNAVVKRINFPADVALSTTYLNDVRFDFKRGREGTAFITDSSDKGPNGIIVVDLATGSSWRRLNDHPSTKADQNFVPSVEGQMLMIREAGRPEEAIKIGSDGIAIDPAKDVLYYCPLASRKLYSVSLDALANRQLNDWQVAETIRELPQRDFASDGLICDANGTLFLTDYEHNAIRRLTPNGTYATVVSDPRMIWPDSMAIGTDGSLYFTANQLNRQARFHDGHDLREKPYVIFRTPLGSRPMVLR